MVPAHRRPPGDAAAWGRSAAPAPALTGRAGPVTAARGGPAAAADGGPVPRAPGQEMATVRAAANLAATSSQFTMFHNASKNDAFTFLYWR